MFGLIFKNSFPHFPGHTILIVAATMSNSVWVRWKDSTSSEWMFDKVTALHDDADISDLRKAFLKQQHIEVSPGAVRVREAEDGEMLKASTMLTIYFMPPAGSVTDQVQERARRRLCF